MGRCRMKLRFLGLCVFLAAGANPVAADLYRWVDKDGKVHYSQSRPKEASSEQTKLKMPESNEASDGQYTPPPDRDAQGNCVSIKCMADQMEADRLERERGYDRARAENERAAKAHSSKSKTNNAPPSFNDKLRDQCRSGLYYGTNSKVNCDDPAALQQEYSKWQKQNKENYDEYQHLRRTYPDIYR